MPIPEHPLLIDPIKSFLRENGTTKKEFIIEEMARQFKVSKEEIEQRTQGGKLKFRMMVSRAINALLGQGRIERVSTGYFQIAGGPSVHAKLDSRNASTVIVSEELDNDEILDSASSRIKKDLAKQLLERVKTSSPAFFESLVVKLLVRMGYGGPEHDAVSFVLGKSGDGGIDGLVQGDPLGLESIYVQAKRYQDIPIGQSDVRDFSGSLDHHGARKGVFVTTSRFTDDAQRFVRSLKSEKKIALIDGERLAELMIDYGIGVSVERVISVKRIDQDFFEEL
jgi:restriction system protein